MLTQGRLLRKVMLIRVPIKFQRKLQQVWDTNIGIFFLWSAIFILTRIFFLYYPFHGEPDVYRMSMGIHYNLLTGEGLFGSFLYGKSFSFGYYFTVFKIISVFPFFLKNLELLFIIITLVSSFLIIFFIINLFSRFSPSKLHLNIFLALWILSPVWWECTTYSHPIVPATALSLAGAICLKNAYNNISWKKSLIYFVFSCLLFFISFSFRAEVMLVTPALFLLCVESARKDKSKLLLSVVSILLAGIIFFIFQNYLIRLSATPTSDTLQKVSFSSFTLLFNFLKHFASFTKVTKGIIAVIFAFGIVSIFFVPLGLYSAIKKGYYRYLIIMFLFIIPSLLFWLPNPTPFRHFLLVIIGLASISSFCFSFFKQNVSIIFLIITITGNVLLPESLHKLILKYYTFNYPNLSQIAGRIPGQVPVGSPILNHVAYKKILEYTKREFNYVSKINENNIIFIGSNNLVFQANFVKNCETCKLKVIDNGVVKLTVNNKNLYFISTDYFPNNKLFENIIQRLGNEYNQGFAWYINPIMQARSSLSSDIPEELKLIKPFPNPKSQ